MSLTKMAIEDDERKHRIAVKIAAQMGVLKRCEFGICAELTWDEDSERRLEFAYRHAARLVRSKDPLTKDFSNQRELTDLIMNLWNDFDDKCACKRLIAKD